MKNKIGLFVICFLFLTGCNVNYKVEFTNGKFSEDVYLFTDNATFVDRTKEKEDLEEIATQMYLWDGKYNNYERKLEFNENNAGFNYHTDFDIKENNTWPSIVNQCYDDIKITKDKNYITIQTSNEFLCYDTFNELEDVTISLKTNYIVSENNADTISANKYIWRITEEEASYKPLYIRMQNKQIKTTKKETNIIPITITIISIIIGIAIIISVKKRKKNNDF